MTLDQILMYLSGPGIQASITFLLFILVPDLLGRSWEEVVVPQWRRPILAVMCMVIPVLAAMTRVWAGYVPFGIDALLVPAILAGGAAYVASTVAIGIRKLPGGKAFRAMKLTAANIRAETGRNPEGITFFTRWVG